MKTHLLTTKIGRTLLMVPFVLLCNFSNAQGVSYCKGLKNPTSFVIASAGNNANALWYGYTGSKDNYTSTCNDWGMRQWGTVIPASQLATTSSGSSCTNGNSVNINGQSDYMNADGWKDLNIVEYDPNVGPTAIESIRESNAASRQIFDLQGRRLNNASGHSIIIENGRMRIQR